MTTTTENIKDLSHIFPNGATSITFARIYSSDQTPCKIRTSMPFEKFPVDPSDYRTDEHNCPTDMVATGIILDDDLQRQTLVCSPVYHEDQLDNNQCKQLQVPYVNHPNADWNLVFPYEARGYCPDGWMLTGVDYFFDKPYVNIRCCLRKDIDTIISQRDTRIKYLLVVVAFVLIVFVIFIINKFSNRKINGRKYQ